MKTIKIDKISDLPKNFTGIVEYGEGTKVWYKNGKKHRDNDKPAIEWFDGDKHWYQHDKRHRTSGGPAIDGAGGYKAWFKNNKKHRTDGPAVIYSFGPAEYYINGIETYKEAVEVFAALFPDETEI